MASLIDPVLEENHVARSDVGTRKGLAVRKRVAIAFRVFSPYTLARINAAAKLFEVIGIESAHRSVVYAWEPQEGHERFMRKTLFRDEPIEQVSPGRVTRAVRDALDEAQPEVVCVPGWSFKEALAMIEWAADHAVPAVVMSESTAFDAPRYWWREAVKRHILRFCSAALLGGTPQAAYAEELGLPGDCIATGYDIVDNDVFQERSAEIRTRSDFHRRQHRLPERYFLVSCRFIEKKNLARLLEAFAIYCAGASESGWDLVMLGDGELRQALEMKASQSGVAERVHFIGFKQYEDLPVYYALAGAFLHVSTVEQWGLVVNEAMACGLPVIVSKTCGCAADLVREGENGWTVDPFDVSAMAERMSAMASDSTDRVRMGQRSEAIIKAFRPEAFANGLARAIDAAAKRSLNFTLTDRLFLKLLTRGRRNAAQIG
jgi:glycosyltransferase involved in cell wall biosynthesis